ncbi:hypothetical protein vseg_016264 [Gypsophila vaccaria]
MTSQNTQEVTQVDIQGLPTGVVELPPYVAIKHVETGRFLAMEIEGVMEGHLTFKEANDPYSPQAQFGVIKATNPSGAELGDVHLRCLYNGKYWIRATNAPTALIKATADQPNEEYLTYRCTLLRALTVASGNQTLLYVSSLNSLGDSVDESDMGRYLNLRPLISFDPATECQIIDCAQLLKLPKVVAFKGDKDRFLQCSQGSNNGPFYNKFQATDTVESTVLYDVLATSRMNCVRIKPFGSDKILRRGPNDWIVSDDDPSTENDLDTLFELVMFPESSNIVALRNLGNNQFCKRLTVGPVVDSLSARDVDPSNFSRLEVVEPVVSRTIEVRANDFMLDFARVYNTGTYEIDRKTVSNPDNVLRLEPLSLRFVWRRNSSWDNTESIKWGGNADFSSELPYIVSESKVAIQGNHQGSYRWGENVSQTPVASPIYYQVLVPPKTTVHVTLMAKRADCDVPFSYCQTDVLANGSSATYNKTDGCCTSTQAYGYEINEVSEPMA